VEITMPCVETTGIRYKQEFFIPAYLPFL